MDSVKALKHVNIAAMLLIAFFNVIDCIAESAPLTDYLAYVAPFLVAVGILAVFKSYKINAVVYALAGLAIGVTSTKGNFSGAIFLIFSIYIFNKPLTNYILLSCCTAAIASRYFFLGYTIPDTLSLFIGYAFTFGVYFILMHPKSKPTPIVVEVDKEALDTVLLLRQGMTVKEVAAFEGVTQSGVYHRRDRVRKAYQCATNDDLYRHLEKIGLVIPISE